mmetsp:Transcript_2468/g.5349  ORF Transcript_2468/g.5349 Transcript_2468/m.5349 type:complete len:417 (-) Transcript_2468:146-1396(-)
MPGNVRACDNTQLSLLSSESVGCSQAMADITGFMKQAAKDDLAAFIASQRRLPGISSSEGNSDKPDGSFKNQKIASLPSILSVLRSQWAPLEGDPKMSSCFVRVKALMKFHLPPKFFGPSFGRGLRSNVRPLLMKWNDELGCMPWAVVDVTPVGNRAAIVTANPMLHFDAEVTLLGFKPEKWHWMRASVSETQTPAGLNLTILNDTSGHVHHQEVPPQLTFDEVQRIWSDDGERTSAQPTWFQVEKIHRAHNGQLKLFGCICWKDWYPKSMITPSERAKSASSKPDKRSKAEGDEDRGWQASSTKAGGTSSDAGGDHSNPAVVPVKRKKETEKEPEKEKSKEKSKEKEKEKGKEKAKEQEKEKGQEKAKEKGKEKEQEAVGPPAKKKLRAADGTNTAEKAAARAQDDKAKKTPGRG